MKIRRPNWELGKLKFWLETLLIFFQKINFVGNGLDRLGENFIMKDAVG